MWTVIAVITILAIWFLIARVVIRERRWRMTADSADQYFGPRITVEACSQCGATHEDLPYRPLHSATFFGANAVAECPATGRAISLEVVECD